MNTSQKGKRNERKARKYLEAGGWKVIVAKRSSRYDLEIDFFGLFDLCASKDGYFRWIQVKSNYCPLFVKEDIRKNFIVDGHFVKKEVWVFKDHSRSNPWIEILHNE